MNGGQITEFEEPLARSTCRFVGSVIQTWDLGKES